MCSRTMSASYHDQVLALCRAAGPRVVYVEELLVEDHDGLVVFLFGVAGAGGERVVVVTVGRVGRRQLGGEPVRAQRVTGAGGQRDLDGIDPQLFPERAVGGRVEVGAVGIVVGVVDVGLSGSTGGGSASGRSDDWRATVTSGSCVSNAVR